MRAQFPNLTWLGNGQNPREIWLDYWSEDLQKLTQSGQTMAGHGVNPRILKVLDRWKLRSEWLDTDAEVVGIYDK